MQKCRLELLNDGYTVRRGIIQSQTINTLRRLGTTHSKLGGIHKHNGVRQPHAFRKAPFIAQVFSGNTLVQFITDCFGTEKWYLTNHADLHTNALSGWHKDDGMTYGNGGYFKRPAYDLEDPKVFKVAIYFQDHIHFNDGITIIPKSHRIAEIRSGDVLHLETLMGDVLIFDPRLSHTGQIKPIPDPLTRYGEKTINSISDKIDAINSKKLPGSAREAELLELFRSKTGVRSSVFFTVAVESESSNIFSITNMERQINELGSETSPFLPVSVIEYINKLGVQSVDSMNFWKNRFTI